MFAATAYIDKGTFREAIAESQMERELSGGNVLPFGAYAPVNHVNATGR